MSRRNAVLTLDPDRREEQLAFIRERADKIFDFGDQIWAAITDDQAPRFVEQGIQVVFHETAGTVLLPAVIFAPPEEPEPPDDLRATEPSGSDTAYYVVEFAVPPDSNWIDAVIALDAAYIDNVPAQAAIFRCTSDAARQLCELPFIDWVGIYHPAYALNFQLAGRAEPFQAAELRNLQVDPAQIVATGTGTLQLTFFSDVVLADVHATVEAAGATIVRDTGYTLTVDIAADRVRGLLRVPGLQSANRFIPDRLFNERARTVLGANQVQNLRSIDFLVNLDGAGEQAGIIDSGIDTGNVATMHPDLKGRIVLLSNMNNLPGAPPMSMDDQNGHGTHTAGSLAGDGTVAAAVQNPPPSASVPRGTAPRCTLLVHSAGIGGGAVSISHPVPFIEVAHRAGARVHSNSYGGSVGNSYTTSAESNTTDRSAFLNPDSLYVFSSGNFEADANADGILDQNGLTNRAVCKNILCIGASENVTNKDGTSKTYREGFTGPWDNAAFDRVAGAAPVSGNFPMSDNADDIALFSSRGRVNRPAPPAPPGGGAAPPAPPGRVRPDVVAPGTNILSLLAVGLGVPSDDDSKAKTAPAGFYQIMHGTSMATPLVAGGAVLARQFYRARFGQLRRPVLLEQVSQFVDLPAASATPDTRIIAWLRHDANGQNHIAAALFGPDLARQTNIVQLQTNVGAHPAIAVAGRPPFLSGALGPFIENSYFLVHRGSDNNVRLSKYDKALAAVGGFGAAGVITLAPGSRTEEDRRPALVVHADDVAVVWHQTGTDNLLFQRFNANTGAALNPAPLNLGNASYASAHPYVVHNGTQYAVLWGRLEGGNHQVLLRFVDSAGALVGSGPLTIVSQPQQIRDPHLVWDSRQNRYLAVWISALTHAGGDVMSVPIRPDGTLDPALPATAVILTPAANTARSPMLLPHPQTGYVLLWEDDTQNSAFDVYTAFLDNNGRLEGTRITETGNRLRISDTPQNTNGFAALLDEGGVMPLWQSNDEVNSDILADFVLNITPQGVFAAEVDPLTPLLNSGRYVAHQLKEHGGVTQTGTALAWAGGITFLLRAEPRDKVADLFLVRTNADGLPDSTFGPDGARRIDTDTQFQSICLKWAESHLIAAVTRAKHCRVLLFTTTGDAVATFGANGVLDLRANAAASISPQLAYQGPAATLRVIVVFGVQTKPTPTIRLTIFNDHGVLQGTAHDLTHAEGTARHGWFHYVAANANPAIIVWHERTGGRLVLRLNRFTAAGAPQHTPALDPVGAAVTGDSQNAVLAPRPFVFQPLAGTPLAVGRQREYGLAWQNRPTAAGARSQILFSQLTANGQRKPPNPATGIVQDRTVASDPNADCTDPQLVWHTDGYGLAWLQQPTGGNHTLMFTALDANGTALVAGGPPYQVSDSNADVQDFQLVWNGRSFRITWTETSAGKLRHMQKAIAVPRVGGVGSYDHPYQQPSSALLRATLINGATNLRHTALPNVGNDPNDGYGWGRVNLRQSLAPAPPVTFYVRDDNSVANRVVYTFRLPPDTLLLRITLAWTDPPTASGELLNVLSLKVTTPAFPGGGPRTYVGNHFGAAANTAQFSDPVPAVPPPGVFESIHNVQQVVIPGAPRLAAGDYLVEVAATINQNSAYQQFEGQPFALIFVGSGKEWPLFLPPTGPQPFY